MGGVKGKKTVMLRWKDSYLMGIEQFDHEHRQLFSLAESILKRVRERGYEPETRLLIVRESLIYLKNYFERHARQEEEYMRQIQYEGYGLHKQLHDSFHTMLQEKYQIIVDRGRCDREEILEFIGTGIGWLLEHITTADMAIVGKGVSTEPKEQLLSLSTIERKLDFLFESTLKLKMNAKTVDARYQGDTDKDIVCHKIVYQKQGRMITVLAGLEKKLLDDIFTTLYGHKIENEMALVLATVEIFGAQFWKTLAGYLIGEDEAMAEVESSVLLEISPKQALKKFQPKISLRFASEKGEFFVATDSPFFRLAQESV